MAALTTTDLQGALPLVNRGKVRDIYALPDGKTLLFVATDRISAYDVVMENGVPNKGKLLTALSEFWFSFLQCRNHLAAGTLDNALPPAAAQFRDQLEGRAMIVTKHKLLPVEAIVRGYITGSAWAEYKKHGTVHGIKVKEGMQESEKFETPLFTPSTKAEQGEHDENIHPDKLVEMIGADYAQRVEKLAIELYTAARDYAAERGIIIADTKFEFGLDEDDNIVLVDEVLTPDSSRFWQAAKYEVGKGQESYDKQYLRDWLTENGLRGKEGVRMPEDIAAGTSAKYAEAFEMITGKKWTQ
ncbi:hypothetical protein EDC01DRAFT_624192 [Geopyxis carbonaria]|nr:hypothetical protein EDC01DRAFT_624192 [Geopyxis carbonaria]